MDEDLADGFTIVHRVSGDGTETQYLKPRRVGTISVERPIGENLLRMPEPGEPVRVRVRDLVTETEFDGIWQADGSVVPVEES